MRGILIAGNVISHLGLFASIERANEVYPRIEAAGIIVRCPLAAEDCPLCKYHANEGVRFHLGEGFQYPDFKLASRQIFDEIREREAGESAERVRVALSNA